MSITHGYRRVVGAALAVFMVTGLQVSGAIAQTSDGVIFEETGVVLASNPASLFTGGGLAASEWTFWCDGEEPFTQGVDGHVFSVLPEVVAGGGHLAALTGDGPEYDLDMYFFDEGCASTGDSATADIDETALVPVGTRYVVAVNFFGLDTAATLRITAGGDPDPDPTPTPTETVEPDPEGCTGTADHVYFLGIVYDPELRDDFQEDIRNFEAFLGALRDTYCIPSSQATILAMDNNFTDAQTGKSYRAGTEANLKAELRRMGADASQHPDSQFFFFLSSHGLMWTGALTGGACPPTRVAGSFSGLGGGGGQDGDFYDCELGTELNNNFSSETRMFVAVDCSFCGGFSDSLTAASGTVPDGSVPSPSGILGPNRIVVTGCAITTECFGSPAGGGGVTYRHMKRVLDGLTPCDGWTAPGFPIVQGFDVPVNGAPFNPPDGVCTVSEWFFAAVWSAYNSSNINDRAIGIQQQFRIKYGFATLAEDLVVTGGATEPLAEPTSVAFTSDSARSGQYRDEVTVGATLVDESGAPIAGEEVAFVLSGAESATWTGTTGADGIASVTRSLEVAPGDYTLTVHYAGRDDVYEASQNATTIAVTKEDSQLGLAVADATGTGKDKQRTLTATLTDDGIGLFDRVVTFSCDGVEIGTARTDGSGVAVFSAPHNCARGSHVYEAVFSGDEFYTLARAVQQS